VSGAHARIRKKEDNLLVIDLDSTNGTYIDDKRLKPGVVTAVFSGSCITFGTTLTFFYVFSFFHLMNFKEICYLNLVVKQVELLVVMYITLFCIVKIL
jgi:pSer/pThr/pTyr-binding forkhead associated (FHA) protein